jgi:hypothetical protein
MNRPNTSKYFENQYKSSLKRKNQVSSNRTSTSKFIENQYELSTKRKKEESDGSDKYFPNLFKYLDGVIEKIKLRKEKTDKNDSEYNDKYFPDLFKYLKEVNKKIKKRKIDKEQEEELVKLLQLEEELIKEKNNISELDQKNAEEYLQEENDSLILESVLRYENRKKSDYETTGAKVMSGGALYLKKKDTTTRDNDWQVTQRKLTFTSTNPEIDNFIDAIDKTRAFIKEIYENEILPLKNSNKKMIMEIKHDAFTHNFYIHLLPAKDWTEDLIWTHFEKICQSKKNDPNFESKPEHRIEVYLDIFDTIRGGTKKSKSIKRSNKVNNPQDLQLSNVINYTEYSMVKRSIITFSNNDEYCLIRGIIIGMWLNNSNLDLTKFPEKLESETKKMVNELSLENSQCGISNIKEIEEYLIHYQITLMHTNTIIWKEPIYVNFNKKFEKYIYIVYDNVTKHYSVIKSMTGFLKRNYYCHKCKVGYDHKCRHSCENICKSCMKPNCCKEPTLHVCSDCKITINNEICNELHTNYCKSKKKCSKCLYFIGDKHVCGDNNKWCKACERSVEIDHICFIKCEVRKEVGIIIYYSHKVHLTIIIFKPKAKDKLKGYVFFDFECIADENLEIGCPNQFDEIKPKKHRVNLAMAVIVTNECFDKKEDERCASCTFLHTFYSISEFCDWSLKQHHTIQIAHNLKVIIHSFKKNQTFLI